MRVHRLDHYSIRTTDLDRTIRFYTAVIGLFLESSSGVTLALEFPTAEAPGATPA